MRPRSVTNVPNNKNLTDVGKVLSLAVCGVCDVYMCDLLRICAYHKPHSSVEHKNVGLLTSEIWRAYTHILRYTTPSRYVNVQVEIRHHEEDAQHHIVRRNPTVAVSRAFLWLLIFMGR